MRHAGQRRCRKCAMPEQQRCVDSGLYLIRQALQGHGIRYICNLNYRKREVDKK